MRAGLDFPWGPLAAGLVLVGAVHAGSAVSIVAPGANEILYGPTRIQVAADRHAARVEIYLDRYSDPICSFTAPPYECEFDAGTRLDTRILRAEAFDAEGHRLGGDLIATYSFVDPDTVIATTLTVPLVASIDGAAPPDLGVAEWRCLYGGEPCEVLEARKLGDNVEGMARGSLRQRARDPMVERPPVSLEVLVDVSPSVRANRIDIEDALRRIINESPAPVEIALSEFAGSYRRLVPFTTSKSKLRRGLRELSDQKPWTCVLGAVRRALSELHSRPGHKALLLISDTQETCEALGFPVVQSDQLEDSDLVDQESLKLPESRQPWFLSPIRASRGAITRTLELSRQVGIPIYVYRVGGDSVTSLNSIKAFETMTAESGGRLISAGDLSGLHEGVGGLIQDLESTWMLDVALPDLASTEHEADLSLSLPPASDPIGLRYPRRWRGGNRDALLLTLLRLGDAEARGWAAEQLRDHRDREALGELLEAYRTEPSAANRIEQMTSIYHVSAYLLLHGDEDDQRAALSTIEELSEIDPILIRRLRPALRAFQNMDPPRKLRLKAERLAQPAPPRYPARSDRQG